MIRQPAVAGVFYPDDKTELLSELGRIMPSVETRLPCIGAMVPHAGYMYSGSIASQLYSQIQIPNTVVILAPNHRGPYIPFALSPDDVWMTPLGVVPVDRQLADALLERSRYLCEDAAPHASEHSAEVHVPFLQYLNPQVNIVPIVIAEDDPEVLCEFGEHLAHCISEKQEPVLIVASSDMTHFEQARSAEERDRMALAEIYKLDSTGLHSTVRRNRISMCGVAPTVAMVAAARILGAKSAELILYGNSGDVTGDYSSIVAYAAVRVF